MKARIESVNVQIGTDRKYTHHNDFDIVDTIKGDITLRISGDKILRGVYLNADQVIRVNDISKELQQKLISVIKDIEREIQ